MDEISSGAQVSTDEQHSSHSTEPDIEVGNLVAVDLLQYEWPQIGKVLNVTKRNVEVKWYDGAYTEPWIPVKKKVNGKYVYWNETIPLASIVLANVELTHSCRLRKNTIVHLKHIQETAQCSESFIIAL